MYHYDKDYITIKKPCQYIFCINFHFILFRVCAHLREGKNEGAATVANAASRLSTPAFSGTLKEKVAQGGV